MMRDLDETKTLIVAKMLALYTPLKRIPDGNPAVEKALEAYFALEDTLESVLDTNIRKRNGHRE